MDKRIIKTKKGLREALKSLLDEKPFDKINVTEICARSQTSRVTFYTYYNDKYDLLTDLYHSLADEAQCQLPEKINPQSCMSSYSSSESDFPARSFRISS